MGWGHRGLVGLLSTSACLVPNPAFVDEEGTTAVVGSSTRGGSEPIDDTSTAEPSPTTDGSPLDGSTTDGSPLDGSTTDGGSSSATSTGEPACEPDGYEPNDIERDAHVLGVINDEAPPLFLLGVLEHPEAEDWFRFDGDDESMLPPLIELEAAVADGPPLGVCVFVSCVQGMIDEMHVCEGLDATHSHAVDSYAHGCCATGSVTFQTQCLGAPNNDMHVWLRVAASSPELEASCIDYVLQYTF